MGTAGYPASAVGVPGAARSNLNPPSLLALALATAQVGVALLLRPWLRRRLTQRRWWLPVALVNLAAMTVYLWHQSALIGVTLAGMSLSAGAPLLGLHTTPHGVAWLAARCAWLPVFGAVLIAVACLLAPAAVQAPPFTRDRLTTRPIPARPRRGCRITGGSVPGRPTEVIAVRDSDPPSRSRAAGQPR